MKHTFNLYKDEYLALWNSMVIKPSWKQALEKRARDILKNKDKYQDVANETNVPWMWIAIAHSMEGAIDFKTHLHNGDPLTRRTRQVPSGRPKVGNPPFTWTESALDALKMKGLHKVDEWSTERFLYELERYNGFGYRNKNINTPYLWSGTNHYSRGKYIRDGVFSSSAVSQQTGAAALWKTLQALEKSSPGIPLIPDKEIVNGSRKLSVFKIFRTWLLGGGASVAALASADNLAVAKDWTTYLKDIAFDNSWIILIGLGVIAWTLFKWAERESIKDYREDRYIPSGHEDTETE